MSKKKPLEIDMCAGSERRDTQGELLSIDGADIDQLQSNGRLNDNHGSGFYNSIGKVTFAKKIFKSEDCDDDRQRYYWDKIKSPYIYVRGQLYDDEDHPNARAAAAILRNIHKSDSPLKIKASVEGGVLARGLKDPTLLARTKVHSIALTFTPANNATLVEPINLDKSFHDEATDAALIKSVLHLAETDVPSFRHVVRHASAGKVLDNIEQIKQITTQLGLPPPDFIHTDTNMLLKRAVYNKLMDNLSKIDSLVSQLDGEELEKKKKVLAGLTAAIIGLGATKLGDPNKNLSKGAMKRLASKPQPRQLLFADGTYEPATDKSSIKRGQIELLKKLIADGNENAYKNINGKTHVLLHRGIGESKPSFSPMDISKDGSLSHQKHGMYTDDHAYASSFAGKNGKVHSAWIPIDSVNTNGHSEYDAGKNKAIGTALTPDEREDTKEMFDEYSELTDRGNHILVNPGTYKSASSEEMNKYLNHTPSKNKVRNTAIIGSNHFNEGSMTGEGDALDAKFHGADPRHALRNDDSSFTTRAGNKSPQLNMNNIAGPKKAVTSGVSDLGYERVETGKPVKLNKAMTAGYGGAGVPTNLSGGGVMQSESLANSRFKYIGCDHCGKEQVHAAHQVKCRSCNKAFSLEKLYHLMSSK